MKQHPVERIFPAFAVNYKGELAENSPLSPSLEENRAMLEHVFSKDGTYICREFSSSKGESFFAAYFDGLVNNIVVYESVLRPIMELSFSLTCFDELSDRVVVNTETSILSTVKDCFDAMMTGDCIVFADGFPFALGANTKGFPVRTTEEPPSEKSLNGPREGFTESVMMNVALVHRKLKTVDFRAEPMTFGTRTQNRAFLCYLDSIVRPELLEEVKTRLSRISMDGVLDTNYLVEQISDHRMSLFRTVGTTQRPDVVAAGLLEGRIALILDGTPVVLQAPYLFVESFQSPEDYYQSFWISSLGRVFRILCYILTLTVPAVFVALVSYHQELLPTDLALSIARARVGVPFPVAVECFFMIAIFEILREASRRLPDSVAQALSIVGAIVLGDAAVSARFIGSTTLIVVAFAGITGLMSPKLENSVVFLRVYLLILASFLGLYGVLFGVLSVVLLLMQMKSFGISYLSYWFSPIPQAQKDALIRGPWWLMRVRPSVSARDSVRRE